MLTITQLARLCGLSRSTILYYEREGLIMPALRSENGYRWYGEEEIARLKSVTSFRGFGLSIANIAELINRKGKSQAQILREHFKCIEQEILGLRAQQKAIVALLNEANLMEDKMVTKQRWVEIMRAAGFDEAAMIRWHQKFEEMEPLEHQKFLESLGIDSVEIQRIRRL